LATRLAEELERRLGRLTEAACRSALLVACGSPAVLADLVQRHGSGRAALEGFEEAGAEMGAGTLERVEEEEALASRLSVVRLTPEDPGWPALLRESVRPPALLYVLGTLPDFSGAPGLALVGSRSAADYGLEVARRFGRVWAESGGVVVSGGALGIDSAAHAGCLEGRGRTVAVLGSGLKRVYPASNRELFDRIVSSGALVSELPLTGSCLPFSFPERNRIIAGLSRIVVIVQARRGSGALYTASFATKCGRMLFVVPGPVDDEGFAGGLELMQGPASVLTGVEHLVSVYASVTGRPAARCPDLPLPPANRRVSSSGLDSRERLVLEYLDSGALHADDLLAATGMGAGELSLLLLEMEMKGWVERAAGNHYECRVRLER